MITEMLNRLGYGRPAMPICTPDKIATMPPKIVHVDGANRITAIDHGELATVVGV